MPHPYCKTLVSSNQGCEIENTDVLSILSGPDILVTAFRKKDGSRGQGATAREFFDAILGYT